MKVVTCLTLADGNTAVNGATGNDGNGLIPVIHGFTSGIQTTIPGFNAATSMQKPQEMKVVTPSHSLPETPLPMAPPATTATATTSGHTRNYEWNGSDWTNSAATSTDKPPIMAPRDPSPATAAQLP